MVVIVIGDWDADGFVSVAEVVYAQEVVGVYPVKSKTKTYVFPSTPRSLQSLLPHIMSLITSSNDRSYVVLLDIAYTRTVKRFIQAIKNAGSYIVFIDHHLSTHLGYGELERVVDELYVGRKPVASLVYTLLKSLGVNFTERLDRFIEAVLCLEGGAKCRNKKLLQLVALMSKATTTSRDAMIWEKIVRWLAAPLVQVSLPFTENELRKYMVMRSGSQCNEIENALVLAPSAIKLFNYRLIKVEELQKGCRLASLATALYRVLKGDIFLYISNGNLLVVKTRDYTAYKIAMALHEQGIAKDIAGHERLAIVKLKESISFETLMETLKRIIVTKLNKE